MGLFGNNKKEEPPQETIDCSHCSEHLQPFMQETQDGYYIVACKSCKRAIGVLAPY